VDRSSAEAMRDGMAGLLLPLSMRDNVPEGSGDMVVVRPPKGSCILPPGLCEESFDVDTFLGRANLLSVLFNAVSAVNREKGRSRTSS